MKCVVDRMKQQSLTWFSWKKLFITCIILIVIGLFIYFYMMFRHIEHSKVEGFEETEEYILEETDMVAVDDLFTFQEEKLYHIAYTRDEQDKQWILFISANDDEDSKEENSMQVVEIEQDDTLPPSKIESLWSKDCEQCELKGSTPAILDNEPLWELTYIDDKNRYVIEYRNLSDGEKYEQLKLNRKYNVKG